MEQIELLFSKIKELLPTLFLEKIFPVIIILIIGYYLIKLIIHYVLKVFKTRSTPQTTMLIQKSIAYSGYTFLFIAILNQLGLNLSAILGAAGVLGIALGFASQTSVSNIISGLFLISEKAFEVGDVINIGDTTGIIESIDILSVKLKTFDNLYIRIPNENMIKSEIKNITKFPVRRMNFNLGVAYKEDIQKVMNLLKELALANEFALKKPEPLLIFKDFGDSALEILLGVWFEKANYINLKNSLMIQIKERFDQENIEIPFPHHTIYTGEATQPFPVKVVNSK